MKPAREIAEEIAGWDWYDCTQPEDTAQMVPALEAALHEYARPLIEALEDVLWLIDSGSVVLPDDDGPNTVTAWGVCGAAHATLGAYRTTAEVERCGMHNRRPDDPNIYRCIMPEGHEGWHDFAAYRPKEEA